MKISIAMLLLVISSICHSQTVIIVPTTAGGAVDLLARKFTKFAEIKTGKSFIVENIGGAGGNIVNGTQVNPKNGGPVFNIDNIEYDNGKKFNYYIYKDADSIFMAGAGGGQAWLITDNTDKDNRKIIIPGSTVDHLTDTDLTYINP